VKRPIFAESNMLNSQIYCERHFRRFFPQVSPDETAFVRTRLRRDLERAGFISVSIQAFDWLHPFSLNTSGLGIGKGV